MLKFHHLAESRVTTSKSSLHNSRRHYKFHLTALLAIWVESCDSGPNRGQPMCRHWLTTATTEPAVLADIDPAVRHSDQTITENG
jgi:hypothetical protein